MISQLNKTLSNILVQHKPHPQTASNQTVAGFRTGTGGAGTYLLANAQGNAATTTITSDVIVTVPTTSNWVILG